MKSKGIYTNDQIVKIGNSIRYLTNDLSISKTKLLKLLYLVEEVSIKKYAIPFFNISFQVWKFGPVAEPIFIEISSPPSMFRDYFDIKHTESGTEIKAKGEFDDFEFSDNDMTALQFIKDHYLHKTAAELIAITHRENSPWYKTAKNKGVLDDLLQERITNTHFVIDLSELIDPNNALKKEMYFDFLEIHGNPNKSELLLR